VLTMRAAVNPTAPLPPLSVIAARFGASWANDCISSVRSALLSALISEFFHSSAAEESLGLF
jgi:hypothetical protein